MVPRSHTSAYHPFRDTKLRKVGNIPVPPATSKSLVPGVGAKVRMKWSFQRRWTPPLITSFMISYFVATLANTCLTKNRKYAPGTTQRGGYFFFVSQLQKKKKRSEIIELRLSQGQVQDQDTFQFILIQQLKKYASSEEEKKCRKKSRTYQEPPSCSRARSEIRNVSLVDCCCCCYCYCYCCCYCWRRCCCVGGGLWSWSKSWRSWRVRTWWPR